MICGNCYATQGGFVRTYGPHAAKMEPGTFIVCSSCSSINRLTNTGLCMPLTEFEEQEIAINNPQIYNTLLQGKNDTKAMRDVLTQIRHSGTVTIRSIDDLRKIERSLYIIKRSSNGAAIPEIIQMIEKKIKEYKAR